MFCPRSGNHRSIGRLQNVLRPHISFFRVDVNHSHGSEHIDYFGRRLPCLPRALALFEPPDAPAEPATNPVTWLAKFGIPLEGVANALLDGNGLSPLGAGVLTLVTMPLWPKARGAAPGANPDAAKGFVFSFCSLNPFLLFPKKPF